ncbi:molybdopterin-dependent oxidoreductase [Tritonibacter mobilis]|uniref:molybdopterin-dependent oxidoreductase n=1 Tax=Tritonibacter mobilis TaxID=379347 RepID=UPI001CD91DB7|nr:molybdopterin-dependent oxidoreductase [Tritonibacter mobilis]MCA2007129.1 molybdopterin-dependent oxidoreductase [Tritonibacter mobilis]
MRYAAISISTCIALAGAALAAEEPVILKVTGLIDDAPAHFTMADLRALPATTLETSTVVTDGVHSFTGVLLRDLLAQLDATGDVITATALNDYVVDIPRADVEQYDVIVGYSMNGAELDRADKGPLWIVYPRDGHEALQDIRYDYRWVWQLSELEIR